MQSVSSRTACFFVNPDNIVLDFIPALTIKVAEDPHFGGHIVEEYDLRPFEELHASASVMGVEIREGMIRQRNLKGSDLYQCKRDAEHASLLQYLDHCKRDAEHAIRPRTS